MQAEVGMRNEQWEPNPDTLTGEDFFQPFPGVDNENRNTYLVENPHDLGQRSDEERWDPLGLESSATYDEFDTHPSDDEAENQYISNPLFLRFE